MNNVQRKQIEKALQLIEEGKAILEQIRDEENDKYDNMPESFQNSSKGEKIQEYANILDDAMNDLDSVIENVNENVITC